MKKSLVIAAGLLASGLFAATASAAPLGGLGSNGAVDDAGLVQMVHDGNTHRVCERSARGWHYHNRSGGYVSCRPRRPGLLYWTWRNEGGRSGWWHRRDRRWHD
jgi:hypothetical protein